jgi:hypothetical protein
MRFSFHVLPSTTIDRKGYVRLFLTGEFIKPTGTTKNIAWLVSMDVPKYPITKDKMEIVDPSTDERLSMNHLVGDYLPDLSGGGLWVDVSKFETNLDVAGPKHLMRPSPFIIFSTVHTLISRQIAHSASDL